MKVNFQQIQAQFADHLREPETNRPPEGVEERRLVVYRELFFNNVRGFVEQAYPVLAQVLGEEWLLEQIRRFWQRHACSSPYFVDIAQSFLEFLCEQREPERNEPPFLLELAHYEWAELAVSIRHRDAAEMHIESEALGPEMSLQLSAAAWPLQYQFPVHQISVDYQPEEPLPDGVFLVIYRDQDEEVQFMAINAVTAKLLELLQMSPGVSLLELTMEMASLLPQYTEQELTDAVLSVIQQLTSRGIICGVKDA